MKLIIIITAAFAVARFFVPVSGLNSADIFKDMAHLWVGFLFGAATMHPWESVNGDGDKKMWLWELAIALTMVEVVAFFVRH